MWPLYTIFFACCISTGCHAIPTSHQNARRDDPPGSVVDNPDYPSGPPGGPFNQTILGLSKFQWQIYKSCPDENRNAVNKAWEDSKRLSDAFASWVPKADYQAAMDMYMGDRNTFRDVFHDFDFQEQIQSMLSILAVYQSKLTCCR
jgi:hypothetical protein